MFAGIYFHISHKTDHYLWSGALCCPADILSLFAQLKAVNQREREDRLQSEVYQYQIYQNQVDQHIN